MAVHQPRLQPRLRLPSSNCSHRSVVCLMLRLRLRAAGAAEGGQGPQGPRLSVEQHEQSVSKDGKANA